MSNLASVSPFVPDGHGAGTSDSAGRAAPAAAEPCSAFQLAKFFPAAIAVRLPVRLIAADGQAEQTVVEYGTAQEVLFVSGLALELGQQVHLRNVDGSLDVEAFVVALQLRSGLTAVAARFAHAVSNWIVKP